MLKSQSGLFDLSLLARSQLWATPFCFRSFTPHLEQPGRSTTQETDGDEDPYRPLVGPLAVRCTKGTSTPCSALQADESVHARSAIPAIRVTR